MHSCSHLAESRDSVAACCSQIPVAGLSFTFAYTCDYMETSIEKNEGSAEVQFVHWPPEAKSKSVTADS